MKAIFSEIPARVMRLVAMAFTIGKELHNDTKPKKTSLDYWNAAQRHLWSYMAGETHDPDTQIDNRIAAIASLMMCVQRGFEETEK